MRGAAEGLQLLARRAHDEDEFAVEIGDGVGNARVEIQRFALGDELEFPGRDFQSVVDLQRDVCAGERRRELDELDIGAVFEFYGDQFGFWVRGGVVGGGGRIGRLLTFLACAVLDPLPDAESFFGGAVLFCGIGAAVSWWEFGGVW